MRVVLEGKQGGGRLCWAAFTARVIVRERVRVAAGGGDSKEGNSTNVEDFHAHALRQEEPAACNTPLLPSRRHFSLVVRRFPHCLLQEQQQSAINIKCATQVLLRVMKFILVSLICISC